MECWYKFHIQYIVFSLWLVLEFDLSFLLV